MNNDELEWWKEKLHDYKLLDRLSETERTRLILGCLEFIINSLQPERLSEKTDEETYDKGEFPDWAINLL